MPDPQTESTPTDRPGTVAEEQGIVDQQAAAIEAMEEQDEEPAEDEPVD